jgi:hypothetical protein
VAASGAAGVAIGAALASESPAIICAVTAASVVTTTAALWSSCVRLASSDKLRKGLAAVYKSDDPRILANSMQTASDIIGPAAANYGLTMASGLAGLYGPRAYSNLRWNLLAHRARLQRGSLVIRVMRTD